MTPGSSGRSFGARGRHSMQSLLTAGSRLVGLSDKNFNQQGNLSKADSLRFADLGSLRSC
jgi:hypothetical protein